MVVSILSLAIAVAPLSADPAAPRPDSIEAAPPRIVHRLAEVVVRAQFHDPLSSETAHLIPTSVLRTLPVSRLTEAIALKAGIVARGELLHVRGGRPGESVFLLEGVPLVDPLRYRAIEIPLLAVREAEVLTGGLDAEYGGSLAGLIKLRTMDPGERLGGTLSWQSDGRTDTHYDRVAGRLGGPLGTTGLGAVATLEAVLDDTHLPMLRTLRRESSRAGSFGWRADNRLMGHLKLAALGSRPRVALEVLANRRVDRPYNPMWSVDGWISTACGAPFCTGEPSFSPVPLPGYTYYRAADHAVMTDDRRLATVLSWASNAPANRMTAALGWMGTRRVTSVGGRDDESYIGPEHFPLFGYQESANTDPFYVYHGDEPFFQKSTSAALTARADYERVTPRGNRAKAGLGATYEAVRMRELDFSTYLTGLDSLRTYRAFAPGAFGYAQGRWVFEGMVLNGGLRAEYFSAGPQAEDQSFAGGPIAGVWSLSPRLGIAYPISVRDVFSLSYVRLQQNPARDFLYENRGPISIRSQLGNPNLKAATAISYQVAVKHSFSERWALQTGLFYRDLFGLVGTRSFVVNNRAQPRYENADEGHATGLELSLLRVAGEASRAELHYTLMYARGTQSLEEGVPYGSRIGGTRLPPVGEHPLDWDRRHTLAFSGWWQGRRNWTLAWSTVAGSALPWTPRVRRQLDADFSLLNTRRFDWEETTNLLVRWRPFGGPLHLGLDVRNLFDRRTETAATISGYPHPLINTYYDDYSAYRTETGLPGGAYWEDRDGDDLPGWVPVHDPRLRTPPRAIRMSLGLGW